jgi:hypothetical protein
VTLTLSLCTVPGLGSACCSVPCSSPDLWDMGRGKTPRHPGAQGEVTSAMPSHLSPVTGTSDGQAFPHSTSFRMGDFFLIGSICTPQHPVCLGHLPSLFANGPSVCASLRLLSIGVEKSRCKMRGFTNSHLSPPVTMTPLTLVLIVP